MAATRHRYLITGGAGFIGVNAAARYLDRGAEVTILDNFSRPGSFENLRWLRSRYGERVRVIAGDVRIVTRSVAEAIDDADVVLHLAAQVAVTTSVESPIEDFDVNARGTLNLLEAVRHSSSRPVFIYSSTNKVYGQLHGVALDEGEERWSMRDRPEGVDEATPLDFHSPYGCSKGAADQYVRDYARIYGLDTIVFRQSCIYGPHQFGIEDQGWLAWFAIQAARQRPVTVYGTGKQVRDVLYVDDLLAAYDAAIEAIEVCRGQAYNIGGGPGQTLSLLELLRLLSGLNGQPIARVFDDWRPGDQFVYVSDIRKAHRDFGWRPAVDVLTGVQRLVDWVNGAIEPLAAISAVDAVRRSA